MANGVNIPIELDVTDIQMGNIDVRDVQKDLAKNLNPILNDFKKGLDFGKNHKNTFSKPALSLFNQMIRGYDRIKAAQDKFNVAVSKAGFSSPKFKADYKAWLDQLEKYKSELDSLQRAFNGAGTAGNKAATLIKIQQTQQDMAKHKLLEPNAGDYISSATPSALNQVTSSYNTISKEWSKLRDTGKAFVKQAVKDILSLNNLKQAATGVVNIGKSLANTFSKAASVLRKFGSAILSSSKHSKTAGSSLKQLWKNMMMYVFGFRSAYYMIKKLRSTFVDQFKMMAKQIPEINTQISGFITGLNGLKGSLATAFQPIITAIIPIINSLIAALTSAMNAIGKFFALLTGQGFIYKATAAQQDYAKSLSGTGSAAKEATKSLMGFDEINRLDADSDSSGGGGGSSDADTVSYEMEKVEGTFNAWLEGWNLMEKIKEKIDAIDWDTVFASTYNAAQTFAQYLNGIFANEEAWASVGYFIGQELNNLTTYISSFFSTFNGTQMGDSLATTISNAITTINPGLIAQSCLYISQQIAGFFVGAFSDPTLFASAGTQLNNIINSLIFGLSTFISQFPIENVKLALTTFLQNAFTNIDVNDLADATNTAVHNLIDLVGVAIENLPWSQLGEYLGKINWSGLFWDLTGLVQKFWDGLTEAFQTWKDTDPTAAAIAESVAEVFGSALIIVKITEFVESVKKIVEPLITFFSSTFGAIILVIGGVITAVTSFVDMWNDGISTAKAIMMSLGVVVAAVALIILGLPATVVLVVAAIVIAVAGLVLVIKEHWEEITDWLSEKWDAFLTKLKEFGENIKDKFNEIKTNVSNKVEELVNNVKTFVTNIKTHVSDTINNIKTTLTNKVNEIKTTVINTVTNIKTGITERFNTIKTGISDTMSNIKTGLSNGWNAVLTTVGNVWNKILDKIKSVVNSIIGVINSMISAIAGGINAVVGAANNIHVTIPSWVPTYGGKTFGINLPTVNTPQIPYLAQGAVIPPNDKFLAVLGDQKSGTNIEAPLETIQQAVADVMDNNLDAFAAMAEAIVAAIQDKDMIVSIGDSAIGEANARYNRKQMLMRGTV